MTNARFEDLEKRVRKLKLKRYVKIFLLLATVTGVGFFVQNNMYLTGKQKPLHVKTILVKPLKTKQVISPKKIKEIVIIKEDAKYETLNLSPRINLPKKVVHKQVVKKKVVIKKEIIVKEEKVFKKKISLHVKEVKTEDVLLARFKSSGDFDSTMSLARFYFKEKKFVNSIFWSKKASKLSSSDDSSWLIYAKSKYAIGKKKEAIKALELYLQYFSSDDIMRLVQQYRSKK